MLLGLRDSDDRIVAATFNALAVLVHILGGGVVVGGEKRKTFFEGRPKVSVTMDVVREGSQGRKSLNNYG